MRTTAVIIALLALLASQKAEDDVAAVNLERLHALAAGDMPRLEQLFSDDFVYVTPAGRIETKDDFRKSIAAGYKLAFVEPENVRVRVHDNVAVVTYSTHRGASANTPAAESISTCVYVQDAHAGWQLVSQQTNRISR